jgi:arginine decarboxylase
MTAPISRRVALVATGVPLLLATGIGHALAWLLPQHTLPLLSSLAHTSAGIRGPFHVPGHKLGQGAPLALVEKILGGSDAVLRHDLTELEGLGSLLSMDGPIAESQALAAEVFGVAHTWFLCNGSTCGVQAAIMGAVQLHKQRNPLLRSVVVLPRNAHRCAVHALILSGAEPFFLPVEFCEGGFDMASGIDTQATLCPALKDLGDAVAAVLLVSPSYEGVEADVGAAAAVCREYCVPLIVDEAHGAHLKFIQGSTGALDAGADIVVHSTHKMLTSLTQSAMLHFQPGEHILDRNALRGAITQSLEFVQSSSPSYPLLASLDAMRWQLAVGGGVALLEEAVKLSRSTKEKLRELQHIVAVVETPRMDPLKLTIDCSKISPSGYHLEERLAEVYGVHAELAGWKTLTFAFGPGSTEAHAMCLMDSLKAEADLAGTRTAEKSLAIYPQHSAYAHLISAMTPREAYFAASEALPAADAIGRISAETLCPYPPGIPVVLLGEILTRDHLSYLEAVRDAGGEISGATDCSLATLKVICVKAAVDFEPRARLLEEITHTL